MLLSILSILSNPLSAVACLALLAWAGIWSDRPQHFKPTKGPTDG